MPSSQLPTSSSSASHADTRALGETRLIPGDATRAILFDDAKGLLGPLCDLRPSFAVRTGALRTRDRWQAALNLDIVGIWVRPHYEALSATVPGEAPINRVPADHEPLLLVNGRCVMPLREALGLGVNHAIVDAQGDLVVARVAPMDVANVVQASRQAPFDPASVGLHVVAPAAAPAMLTRPWSVRTFRDQAIDLDLALLAARIPAVPLNVQHVRVGKAPLHVHPDATVLPGSVFDTEHGPIVIDRHATIRPGSTLIGPLYVGRHSSVLDRAIIKSHTAIGPWCKVAGEVGGTIFHGYANKGHDGHLGDSWIGRWANLGAGTTNSNLLNTYAEVSARAHPDSPTERTGQQFLGAIIGDHVKTAIGTRLMTGVVVHTGAMLALSGYTSGCIPAFAWCTDEHKPGSKHYRIDKFLEVAHAVMARRKKTLLPEYAEALRRLFDAATVQPASTHS
jgi:UDP-N-acetylglucosamine diphosphorylase/glucosamine-1-phosphate N-acetyltransferase